MPSPTAIYTIVTFISKSTGDTKTHTQGGVVDNVWTGKLLVAVSNNIIVFAGVTVAGTDTDDFDTVQNCLCHRYLH